MVRRRLPWVSVAGAAAIAITALTVLLVRSPAASSPANAVLERVRPNAEANSARILITRHWGEGELVLTSYSKVSGRRLGLGFASPRGGGWRLTSYTEEDVALTDVAVGSLLVASSEGGKGQPAWSAAAGELRDARIDRVEIRWASGQTSSSARHNDAYLVVQEGTTTPLEARYLAKEGTEIAKVPIHAS